jgi:hypothetical protein
MRHILHRRRTGFLTTMAAVTGSATYQTKLNPSEHSKSFPARLTLVTLWNLRVPPMVRTAFIILLLVPFFASSARASRLDATRTRAHASINKGSIHRTRRAAHPVSHSTRTTSRSAHPASRKGSAYSVPRRSVHSSRSHGELPQCGVQDITGIVRT